MKRILVIIFFSTSVLFTSCNQKLKKTAANKFRGLWKLYVIEQQDSVSGKWKEWGNGLQGYILYDDKDNMAIHLTSKDYQKTDIKFHNFARDVSIEELKYRTQSYVYFAKYTLFEDEKIVEHARISHSNPNEWNMKVKRWYQFEGDTLVLSTSKDKSNSPLRVKWIKY